MGTLSPQAQQGYGYQHARPKKWWDVLCSVKILVALGIVVLFWVLIILGAVGRIRSVG
jgi:hypothetical protein